MSDALADLAAGAARCVGPRVGDEMAQGGSVPGWFCAPWFLTHEICCPGILLTMGGRTMVLPGMSDALADLAAALLRDALARMKWCCPEWFCA